MGGIWVIVDFTSFSSEWQILLISDFDVNLIFISCCILMFQIAAGKARQVGLGQIEKQKKTLSLTSGDLKIVLCICPNIICMLIQSTSIVRINVIDKCKLLTGLSQLWTLLALHYELSDSRDSLNLIWRPKYNMSLHINTSHFQYKFKFHSWLMEFDLPHIAC